MRWPLSLLFRGDRDTHVAADAAAPGPGAPGAAAPPAAAAGGPARPVAWAGLPPVQRTAGDFPLTAPAAGFVRDLAGRRPPETILRPLAHDIAADGPAGLVSGIATPLAPPAATTASAARAGRTVDLPASRAVQRRARSTTVAAPPARPAAPAPDADAVASRDALPDAPIALRSLPVVAQRTPSGALAATRVGPASVPAPARAVAPAAGPPVSTGPAEHGPVPDTVAGPFGPPASPAGPAGSSGEAEAPAAPVVQRRSLGESRRLGLGAPLAARPSSLGEPGAGRGLPLARLSRAEPPAPRGSAPSARPAAAAPAPLPVLRLAASPAAPAPAGAAAGQGDGPATEPAAPAAGREPGAAPGGEVPGGSVPSRPADRPLVGDAGRRMPGTPSADGGDADGGTDGDGGSVELPLAAPAVAGSGSSVAALPAGPGVAAPAGERALDAVPAVSRVASADAGRPAAVTPTVPLVVARSMRGSGPALRSVVAAVPEGPVPVVARRTGGAARAAALASPAGPAAAGSSGGAPSTAPGAPVPMSTPAPAPTLAPAAPAASSPALDRQPAGRSTQAAGSPPAASAPPGSSPLPVARLAASSGSSSTTAAGPITIARHAAADRPSSPADAAVLGWTAGAGFAAVPADAGPTVQRTVQIGEVSSTVEAQPSGGAAAEAAGSSSGGGQDYEEIADRVYDRIRSRFATELLLDRERMGLLIDG